MELWKKIPGFKNYSASNLGRIRNDNTKHIITQFNHILKGQKRYLFVHLYIKNKIYQPTVHHLVMLAWKKNHPLGKQASHEDQNIFNNKATNLKYRSQSNNIKLSFTMTDRNKNTGIRLTMKQYNKIFELHDKGYSQLEIGRIISCHNSTVSKILSGSCECYYKPNRIYPIEKFARNREMYNKYKLGKRQFELAEEYHIDPKCIWKIIHREIQRDNSIKSEKS